jgi:Lrp/AsnC family transcriptional regulator, leucine-responsive regulatory protein
MDDIDLKIVDLLQGDARLTQQEVARRVGLSQPSVAERIRKLEEAKVILGYTARVDPRRLGQDITAFIGVVVEHPKYFESFARRVLAMSEVLECHRVAGPESYLLKVRTRTTGTLDELLVEKLRTIPGVARTQTTIVLASAKEETHVASGGPS